MDDHPRLDVLLRAEFETRLDAFKLAMLSEIKAQNQHQDIEFNKGLRAIRDDYAATITAIRGDLRSFVTNDVFIARLSPVQAIAYGMVALLMSIIGAFLAAGLWTGRHQ